MTREPSLQQQVDAGERVCNFLKDEAVKGALVLMEEAAYDAFRSCSTAEDRLNAWAEARAIGSFSARMSALMSDGDRARQEIIAQDARLSRPDAR